MKEELENALAILAQKAAGATADEAVKYTQAVLNSAQALIALSNIKEPQPPFTPPLMTQEALERMLKGSP